MKHSLLRALHLYGDHAVFEDVFCPHVKLASFPTSGSERKQRLVSESHACYTFREKLLERGVGVLRRDDLWHSVVPTRISSMVRLDTGKEGLDGEANKRGDIIGKLRRAISYGRATTSTPIRAVHSPMTCSRKRLHIRSEHLLKISREESLHHSYGGDH